MHAVDRDVALFALGAVLARSRLQAPHTAAGPERRSDVLRIVLYKLIVHPARSNATASTDESRWSADGP